MLIKELTNTFFKTKGFNLAAITECCRGLLAPALKKLNYDVVYWSSLSKHNGTNHAFETFGIWKCVYLMH